VAGADHKDTLSGVAGAFGVEDVGHAVVDAVGSLALADGGQAGGTGRARGAPGAGRHDDGAGEEAALEAVGLEPDLEGLFLAPGVPDLARALPGDAGDARVQAQAAGDIRERGERREVTLDKLTAGRESVEVRHRPAVPLQQGLSRPVDVVAPGGEHGDMAPGERRRADRGTGFQDDRLQAALQQMGRGGEADRAAANDGDGQRSERGRVLSRRVLRAGLGGAAGGHLAVSQWMPRWAMHVGESKFNIGRSPWPGCGPRRRGRSRSGWPWRPSRLPGRP
jgi:hypothetical protein